MLDNSSPEIMKAHAHAQGVVATQLAGVGGHDGGPIQRFLMGLACMRDGKIGGMDWNPGLDAYAGGEMAKSNAVSRAFRRNSRGMTAFPAPKSVMEAEALQDAFKKSALDVGSLTNLAQVTGGQALGIISMDYRMARGTVRPRSFTLYNALNKTPANQIVDYWSYASDIGGGLPGTTYSTFANQTSGVIATNSGSYSLKFLNLKLALDGRALTVALASQNSFVDIGEQENANAALNILQGLDWTIYWGNPAVYANQPQGIAGLIPARNQVDFQKWSTSQSNTGFSQQQLLYQLIYDWAGFITNFRQFGQVTHAFMTPTCMGDLQQLVTARLDNFMNLIGNGGVVVNGDLQGMKTRFGDIQFPMDFFITARDTPAQGITREDGTNFALAAITPATSITAAVTASGSVASGVSSDWAGAYVASGAAYVYAVAACDASSNESLLTYSGVVTGIAAGGDVILTVTPNGATAAAFRIYRSGLGYNAVSNQNPAAFRFIGEVVANGASAVTFTDANNRIPGAETIFLLDLDDDDQALDYRYLLPLTKIELFAQNLFMPWAVAHIGAPRLRIPKFNGIITNYVPANPSWNPLQSNANAT